MAYFYGKDNDAILHGRPGGPPGDGGDTGDGGGGGGSPGANLGANCNEVRQNCIDNWTKKIPPGNVLNSKLNDCERFYQLCLKYAPINQAPGTEDCGLGATEAREGCACGRYYNLKSSADTCRAGYVKVMSGTAPNGARCECQKWCREIGYADDCTTKVSEGAEGAGKLGEYTWPEELSSFYKNLMGRGQELLGMPLGYSPEAQAAAFGQDFEKVRGQERGARESLLGTLSREGMLGTGASIGAMKDLAWGTEKNISDVQRDLFVQNELQKKKDIQDYTVLADTLFGQGVGYNQIQEAINAARRGEGTQALALWLSLLGQMGELA